MLDLLDAVQARGLPVISFDGLLCESKVCKTMLGDVPLYRDYGHFSIEGSKQVVKAMQLGLRVAKDSH